MTAASKKESGNIFLRMRPLERIAISLGCVVIVFFAVRNQDLDPKLFGMLLWDVFCLTYVTSSLFVFFGRSTEQIRKQAQKEDGSRILVFFLVLISSFASMLTVLLLLTSKDKGLKQEFIYLPVAIGGMLLSWIMVHIVFSFHYAHLFYQDHKKNSSKPAGGLNFPEEKNPTYTDFAYFSFVIGMTFQVSDVEITDRILRRLVLVHGLISFGLNTFVVALTINIVGSLGQ